MNTPSNQDAAPFREGIEALLHSMQSSGIDLALNGTSDIDRYNGWIVGLDVRRKDQFSRLHPEEFVASKIERSDMLSGIVVLTDPSGDERSPYFSIYYPVDSETGVVLSDSTLALAAQYDQTAVNPLLRLMIESPQESLITTTLSWIAPADGAMSFEVEATWDNHIRGYEPVSEFSNMVDKNYAKLGQEFDPVKLAEALAGDLTELGGYANFIERSRSERSRSELKLIESLGFAEAERQINQREFYEELKRRSLEIDNQPGPFDMVMIPASQDAIRISTDLLQKLIAGDDAVWNITIHELLPPK